MGKKSKALATISLSTVALDPKTLADALQWHREGQTYDEIAERLDCSPWEAKEFIASAYQSLLAENADALRAHSELRILDVIRRLNDDLRVARTQPEKNSIYSLILKADGERRKLLGLDIPAGTPDAPGGSDA